jgi:hypothetical protein
LEPERAETRLSRAARELFNAARAGFGAAIGVHRAAGLLVGAAFRCLRAAITGTAIGAVRTVAVAGVTRTAAVVTRAVVATDAICGGK